MRHRTRVFFILVLGFLIFPGILAGVDDPLTYEALYETSYQKCNQSAEQQGVNDCEPNVINCMNLDFTCLKQEAECSVSVASNGKLTLACKKSTGVCPIDVAVFILKYREEGKDCTDMPSDFSKPGCGNGVTEIHEKCDDGNTAGNDACPADCGVVTVEAAPEPAAPGVTTGGNQDSAAAPPSEPRTSSCSLKK